MCWFHQDHVTRGNLGDLIKSPSVFLVELRGCSELNPFVCISELSNVFLLNYGVSTITLGCYLHFTKHKSEPKGDIYL